MQDIPRPEETQRRLLSQSQLAAEEASNHNASKRTGASAQEVKRVEGTHRKVSHGRGDGVPGLPALRWIEVPGEIGIELQQGETCAARLGAAHRLLHCAYRHLSELTPRRPEDRGVEPW